MIILVMKALSYFFMFFTCFFWLRGIFVLSVELQYGYHFHLFEFQYAHLTEPSGPFYSQSQYFITLASAVLNSAGSMKLSLLRKELLCLVL
jgi:hypothetical protein